MKNLRKSFFRGNQILFILTVLFGILGIGISIAFAYLLQRLLDVANTGTIDELKKLILFSLIIFAALFLVEMLLKRIKAAFLKKAMLQYKNDAFEMITKKGISSFASETTSSYLSILTNDATYIEDNYLVGLIASIAQLTSFFGALALMIYYNWMMTLAVILSCSIPIGLSIIFGKKLQILEKEISKKNENFMGKVKDLLSGFFIIKSFQAENTAIKLFDNENEELESEKENRKNTEGTINAISSVLSGALQIAVFVVGAFLAIKGDITVGVVLAFVQLMNNIMEPIQTLPALFAKRKAASGLIDKMEGYAKSNEEEVGTLELKNINNGIKFEDVSFSYNDDGELALKDINLNFEKGKSYAVVGESGSGKSTILRLIMRGYLNYTGDIKLDEKELKDVDSTSLYNLLSIVQQDVFIFNSTIKDNITLYKNFDEDKINKAIELAGLRKLIANKGIDFNCGENGVNLSGGERQRISIARSLLKNTEVLLMDEATSALDAETSKAVLDQILSLDELTRIVITHSLKKEELKKFDEIIVMRNGMVQEKGSYEELVEKKDYFYSLCNIGI
ncbi:MAG: ABC transporter ATP-binding protein [Eubacteriales bacterium]|uniref:ABC transporter ATP-binding protein n=1 Tax=Fenollaria sp. TaxID=1965292 RepID=UPI002A7605CC|nr:ABC transporter ATP-binding protein [Fenollaria sp.]MDD7340315.1 ABC transporter ATP-binding protein [Eubacteriales bacterium]MDY3106572.1 ABC transporter ATP-binding protein [Fenollaria sp.]